VGYRFFVSLVYSTVNYETSKKRPLCHSCLLRRQAEAGMTEEKIENTEQLKCASPRLCQN